jgi:tetratricopeptide (TPR) repeat protein
MCTWVQSYNIDLKTFRSIVKTFSTTFPNMTLWRAGKSDCLLVGAKGPLSMNYGILKKRLKDMGISQDLKRIDIRSAPDFLVQLVMGPNNATRFGDPAEIHTDDNALVEFSAPRAMTRTGYQWPLIEAIENFRDPDLSFLVLPDSNPAGFEELADIKAQSKNFIMARGHVFQSHILRNRNQTQEASSELQKAVALNPADPMLKEFNAADHRRAFYLAKGGKIVQAIALYQKMVQRVPGDEKAHYNLALLLKRQGRLHDALRHYKEAARLKPDYVIAVYNVGEVSQQLGDLDTAFSSYQKALKLKPDLVPALNSLAWLFSEGPDQGRRDPIKAVRLAEKANNLTNNQDPYLLETLGVAYAAAGRQADADLTFQQALSFAEKTGDRRLVQRLNTRLKQNPTD